MNVDSQNRGAIGVYATKDDVDVASDLISHTKRRGVLLMPRHRPMVRLPTAVCQVQQDQPSIDVIYEVDVSKTWTTVLDAHTYRAIRTQTDDNDQILPSHVDVMINGALCTARVEHDSEKLQAPILGADYFAQSRSRLVMDYKSKTIQIIV